MASATTNPFFGDRPFPGFSNPIRRLRSSAASSGQFPMKACAKRLMEHERCAKSSSSGRRFEAARCWARVRGAMIVRVAAASARCRLHTPLAVQSRSPAVVKMTGWRERRKMEVFSSAQERPFKKLWGATIALRWPNSESAKHLGIQRKWRAGEPIQCSAIGGGRK